MREPQGPCKDCGDRTAECHASCSKYKEYRERLKEYRIKVYHAKAEESLATRPWMRKNSKAQKEFEKEVQRDRKE